MGAGLTSALVALGIVGTTPSALADEGVSGERVYARACLSCHGADGMGSFPGVPDLTEPTSALAGNRSDLLRRVIAGVRTPGAAMAMPPRGGDPSLSDDDLAAALDYMRTEFLPIQK
ncbi:cytochrome c [Nitrogeniibacter mangrovi]|uniref:Cytochrome c n=1 Tax=Nitrogeniibacter mangrovi TaxID=2016596 RepID=A0A6C1B4I5_9RHOO|nr:cytochrome c [Nitrogeniibacter mangrovi]QID17919.1 cytochrome c [Nitrogeniibacter mangrovi]